MLEHFKFLKAHAKAHAEDDHSRHRRFCISAWPRTASAKRSIRTSTASSDDLGETYKKAVKAFYDAGCRYLQFDDTVWAYLCSQEELRKARERMANVDELADASMPA